MNQKGQPHYLGGNVCLLNQQKKTDTKSELYIPIVVLVSSVRRALASKLRDPGFKSRLGTVGGLVTIIMWAAQPG